jgi:glycosyltransferase involved in cell wall biosynthesis
MSTKNEKVAFVIFSADTGGAERRIFNIYKQLSKRYPEKYHLITNKRAYNALQRANYHLQKVSNIHVLNKKSSFDFKTGAHQGILINIGRVLTLFKYRQAIKKVIKRHKITTIQVYMEMLRFLGFFPIKNVKMIGTIVTHLPKYFEKNNINCSILLNALNKCEKVDCVSSYPGESLMKLGFPREKLNYPRRNCVNHIQFVPEKKEKIVTFSARMVGWKKPSLILDAIIQAEKRVDKDVKFYIMGKGAQLNNIKRQIIKRGLEDRIVAGFQTDPSKIVNKSMVHASVEEYDNFTNQSLLEGMAASCGIIATDVGRTKRVVTPDVGILVSLSPKELADAIVYLLKNPKLVHKLGKNARKKILEEHSIDMYIDYLQKLHDFKTKTHVINGEELPIHNNT